MIEGLEQTNEPHSQPQEINIHSLEEEMNKRSLSSEERLTKATYEDIWEETSETGKTLPREKNEIWEETADTDQVATQDSKEIWEETGRSSLPEQDSSKHFDDDFWSGNQKNVSPLESSLKQEQYPSEQRMDLTASTLEKTEVNASSETNDVQKLNLDDELSENEQNTDDNGKLFKDENGELLPNQEYECNEIKYKTDDKGRITQWEGKLKDAPENERDNYAQAEVGGKEIKTESSDAPEIKKDGELLSTYDERLSHVPQEGERGHWEGERGESKFVPADGSEVQGRLEQYGQDGVAYKDSMPDFAPFSESNVEIDNMTDRRFGRGGNFDQADAKCAEQWNADKIDGRSDWSAEDVKYWRGDNGYSWHECNDRKTCQLVPTEINDYFGHLGGVSECKKANQQGSKFDA